MSEGDFFDTINIKTSRSAKPYRNGIAATYSRKPSTSHEAKIPQTDMNS